MGMIARHIAFCLCQGLPLFGLVSMLEVFRHANRLSGCLAYRWSYLTENDDVILDNNHLQLHPSAPLADVVSADLVLVVAGFAAWDLNIPNLITWIQTQADQGAMLGGISNGSFILARAGLIDGYTATAHWEDFASFSERHPRVHAQYRRWVIDRQRMSCSGGAATLDLAIEVVRQDMGDDIARRVSRQMLLENFEPFNRQDVPKVYDGSHHYSPRVQQILHWADIGIEGDNTVNSLAKKTHMSRRELLRVLKKETGFTPSQLLKARRLERARSLIQHSDLSLASVADSVGFSSQSHMTMRYRQTYGATPAQDRRACQSPDY